MKLNRKYREYKIIIEKSFDNSKVIIIFITQRDIMHDANDPRWKFIF